MKLDLHCHTLKCKKGDSYKRNVTKDVFIKKVKAALVDIVAITNHNVFDINQYNDFLNEDFLIWPGIELDVIGFESSGHCIIIVNPNQAQEFADYVKDIIKTTPDDFKIDVQNFAIMASKFDSIVTCHYNKNPNLSDADIDYIKQNIGDNPLFLEPSNLTSVGIYLAHNKDCILGSDVKNWDNYEKLFFPELKMEVDSYEHFKLLIKKDPEVIKTFIDKKTKKEFDICPFEDINEKFHIKLYNDTNIIIGGKGTGKTKILKGIKAYFETIQNDCVSSYFANDSKESFTSITKCTLLENDFENLNCSKCEEEFKFISEWKSPKIEKLTDYYQWILNKKANMNFGFCNASFSESISYDVYDTELKKYNDNKEAIIKIRENKIENYLVQEKKDQLDKLLTELLRNQKDRVIDEFSKVYSLYLEDFTIKKMKNLYQIKKGKNSKPNNIGLLNMFDSCVKIYNSTKRIIDNMNSKAVTEYKIIGEIPNKGFVNVKREIVLNPDVSSYQTFNRNNKSNLKDIKKSLIKSNECCFNGDIVESISTLTKKIKEYNITNLIDFMQMKATVVLSEHMDPKAGNVKEYTPSNGEQAMLLLNHSLYKDKDVYILDEPEMSVGHDYVNRIIVPRIIELSKLGKIIVISTHDANVAVRTLPFVTLYRCEKDDIKKTYYGNPFNDVMINVDDADDSISWAKTCIDTLEGGSIAFRERGISYGRENI